MARARAAGTRRWSAPRWFPPLAIVVGLVVAFLWRPLSGGGYYTPADVLTGPLFGNFAVPKNFILTDVAEGMNPFLSWSREQMRAGHLPIWNPYNGAGVPFLGNGTSAVFSIFTLPYYLLSFRTALIVAPFLKLLTAGLGTYVFLRLAGVTRLAAIVGGVSFMFAAFNIVWLSYTPSSVAVLVPWLMVFAHLATRPRTSTSWLATVGLAFTIGAVLVAGHPETAVFACVLVGGYLVARVLARFLEDRSNPESRREWLAITRRAAIGVALGCGLSAVQLLPYVEYFFRSASNATRSDTPPSFLDGRFVALHAFPKLLGAPTGYQDRFLQLFNFNVSLSLYIGLLVLSLAGAGTLALIVRRRLVPGFFALAALGWALYAYNVAGFGTAVSKLPIARFAIPDRLNFVWVFSMSVLAAFGLDALTAPDGALRLKRRPGSWPTLVGIGAGGLLVLLAAWAALAPVRHALANSPFSPPADHPLSGSNEHYVLWTFLVGLVAIGVLVGIRRHVARMVAGAVLIAMIFAQGGLLLRSLNPTVADSQFYPRTSAIDTMLATVGRAQTLTQASANMFPSVNLWYRMHSPETYDSLGIKEYDSLYRALLRQPPPAVSSGSPIEWTASYGDPLSLSALQGLGVAYMATNFEYPYGRSVITLANPSVAPPALVDGQGITQTIGVRSDGLNELLAAGPSGQFGQTCHMVMTDPSNAAVLRRASAPCGEGMSAFSFDPLQGVGGRSVAVEVWSGRLAGPPTAGAVVVDGIATNVPGLQPVARNDWLRIYRVPGVFRYSSPGRSVEAADPGAATQVMLSAGFQPNDTVVVQADAGKSEGAAGRVTVVSEGSARTRLHVERSGAGWVLARVSDFPGWHATVNGHAAPIVRADAAFMAVRVPDGASDVVLDYRPTSVTIGLIVSALSAIGLLAIALASLLALRSRSKRVVPTADAAN